MTESKSEVVEGLKVDTRDYRWLFETFGIVTSFTLGQYVSPSEVKIGKPIPNISLSAKTFLNNHYNHHYGAYKIGQELSTQTLKNIVKEIYIDTIQIAILDEKSKAGIDVEDIEITEEEINSHLTREVLENYISQIIENELGMAEAAYEDHPIWNLCNGVLYGLNWKYLSDEDLVKWCVGYGAFKIETKVVKGGFHAGYQVGSAMMPLPGESPEIETLVTPDIKMAVSAQNAIVRELVSHGILEEVRGVTLEDLIQPQYDPDYKEPIKSSSFQQFIPSTSQPFIPLTSQPFIPATPQGFSEFSAGIIPEPIMFQNIAPREAIAESSSQIFIPSSPQFLPSSSLPYQFLATSSPRI